jgi:hypothetical protein
VPLPLKRSHVTCGCRNSNWIADLDFWGSIRILFSPQLPGSVDKPLACRFRPGSPRQRPHSLLGEGGRCSSVVTPRNVWIGTLGTAQNAVSFTTGPSKPGRLSSICFEVQPRSGNEVTQWSSIREALCTGRLASCLTSFGRTTFLYDYGPFVSEVIGPNESICAFLGVPRAHVDLECVAVDGRRCHPDH